MKNLIKTAIFVLFAVINTYASDEEATLLGDNSLNGGYGGPIIQYRNGEMVYGGSGTIILNKNILLGMRGLGKPKFPKSKTTTRFDFRDITGTGSFEFFAGYVKYDKSSVFAPYTTISIGKEFNKKDYSSSLISQLDIGVQVKLSKFFRLTPSIGYRYAFSPTEDIKSSVVGNLNFYFGKW